MKNSLLNGLVATAAIGLLVQVGAKAQPPTPVTKSLSHAIHAVNELDTTLAFYKDVFGLNGIAQDFANPAVPLLTNAPGVTLRLSMLTLPNGMRFELTHFKGLERKAAQAKYTDPGAAGLVFYVRDIDTLVANAKKVNATIQTTGGNPVEITTATGKTRSIILRDPDGYFLQMVQEEPAANAPAGNVHRVSMAYTMEDADATTKFYTGQLGIPLSGSPKFSNDAAMLKLYGVPPGVEFRKLSGTMPLAGTAPPAQVEFTEFKGTPRSKFLMRVRDPGAPGMCIQVNELRPAIAKMKAAGTPVLSVNQEIVDFGGGTFTIFVQDPNGMNLEVFERNAPQGKQGPQTKQAK